jgi:AraC-like DNA-binding protein
MHLSLESHRVVASCSEFAEPTLAARTLLPFVEVLVDRSLIPDWLSRSLIASHPDARMPLSTALTMLDNALAISGDPDLGLHAALRGTFDTPLLEYAAVSSSTVREAQETFARYIKMVNDGFEVRLSVESGIATLEFRDQAKMPRAAIDFAIAAFHLARLHWEPGDACSQTQICFGFGEPTDVRTYEKVFAPASVRFGQPFHGLRFPAERLDLPMIRADAKLHDLLLRSVEDRLAELPSRLPLSQRVRKLLRESDRYARASAKTIADRLQISPRTLSRRLEEEGTSFKALLDETRCGLALRYLLADHLSVTQTAQRLGFSEPASFYKAFRRWFGKTPSQYVHQRQ